MQLGMLGFEVSDLDRWRTFLADVLGLVEVEGNRWRNDGHAWRIQLTEGPADDLAFVGWEFTDEELDDVLTRVEASQADPTVRGVRRRYTLLDPAGIPLELYCGPGLAEVFSSDLVKSGFVADEQGLGHLVITSNDKPESFRFYTELLGLKLSDHIVTEMYGHKVDLSFFHANSRHHSLAFGGPQRKRLHHVMFEARNMDDVGLCYDRCIRGGVRIMQTLGRHPNDRMFSFYAQTPSRFQFEFGWGGREVDDDNWSVQTYDCVSEWGHHPPQIAFPGRSQK